MTFDELLTLVSSAKAAKLCVDSRLLKAGDIFIAIKGTSYDGHDFINQALEAGAEYIVCQKPCPCKNPEIITVEDSSMAAAIESILTFISSEAAATVFDFATVFSAPESNSAETVRMSLDEPAKVEMPSAMSLIIELKFLFI